ncbi:MAG: hypothetical protein GF388_05965 [Candidatus Aegiribacteria sp.]|nr:hypothetical protein [Candidatus Aegiribacteria sp.]MBD3294727.1 hypothetical protein [Candidatus Fermentibacteria bacterium]
MNEGDRTKQKDVHSNSGPSPLERLREAENRLSEMKKQLDSFELELRKMARQMGVESSLERNVEPHAPESTSRTDAPVIEAPVTNPKKENG